MRVWIRDKTRPNFEIALTISDLEIENSVDENRTSNQVKGSHELFVSAKSVFTVTWPHGMESEISFKFNTEPNPTVRKI